MAAKALKCAAGCGATQAVTTEVKDTEKVPYTLVPKWTCPKCLERRRKRAENATPAAQAQTAGADPAKMEPAKAQDTAK